MKTTNQCLILVTLFTTVFILAPNSEAKAKGRKKKIVSISFQREPSAKNKKPKAAKCQLIVCDKNSTQNSNLVASTSKNKLTAEVGFGGAQGAVSEADIEPLKPRQFEALAKRQNSNKKNINVQSYIEPINDSQFDQ